MILPWLLPDGIILSGDPPVCKTSSNVTRHGRLHSLAKVYRNTFLRLGLCKLIARFSYLDSARSNPVLRNAKNDGILVLALFVELSLFLCSKVLAHKSGKRRGAAADKSPTTCGSQPRINLEFRFFVHL